MHTIRNPSSKMEFSHCVVKISPIKRGMFCVLHKWKINIYQDDSVHYNCTLLLNHIAVVLFYVDVYVNLSPTVTIPTYFNVTKRILHTCFSDITLLASLHLYLSNDTEDQPVKAVVARRSCVTQLGHYWWFYFEGTSSVFPVLQTNLTRAWDFHHPL